MTDSVVAEFDRALISKKKIKKRLLEKSGYKFVCQDVALAGA